VLQQLRDEIVGRRLAPGTILKDAEVASRLGVSITPVREAISQLASEGLVDISPNRTRHVTHVTQKSTLELLDVIAVLSGAGFEWGVDNLTESHMVTLRRLFQEFDISLQQGDLVAARAAGNAFSNTVIEASGNRELQTHIDLVVSRSLRILGLTSESQAWNIWRTGYRDLMRFLEAGDKAAALRRHKQIYRDYRACVEDALFAEP
jgi:DNA-binding GntR family transcriptional regulator